MMDTQEQKSQMDETPFKYAWDFFSLHANQRLQGVNFFLIAYAFLISAFAEVLNNEDKPLVAFGIGILGTIFAIIFYKIECRIQNLIHLAEEPLKKFESEWAKSSLGESILILQKAKVKKPGVWHYSKVFRYFYFVAGLSFLAGSIYAAAPETMDSELGSRQFTLVIILSFSALLAVFSYELLVLGIAQSFEDKGSQSFGKWIALILGTLAGGLSLFLITTGIFHGYGIL